MAFTWRTSKTGVGSVSVTIVEPTSAALGDFEFALFAMGAATDTLATPAGWTQLFASGAGTNTRYYVFSVTGGRGASAPGLVFTVTGSGTLEWHCLGVAGSNLVIDASAAQAITTGTTPDPPSATATQGGDEAIAIGFNFAGATWTKPSGYDLIRSINTGGLDCVAASKDLTAAGAENPGTFTGPGSSNDIYAVTILLQAPGGVAPHVTRPFPWKPGSYSQGR